MKNILLSSLIFVFSIGFSSATVTLQFTSAFSDTEGVAFNFANAAGVATNGMVWGIIVDTDNTGFSTTYDAFTPTADSVTLLGSGTTNVLITSSTLTANNATSLEVDGGFNPTSSGGDGGISGIASIDLTGGVGTGDIFRLVWFDPSGTSAGFVDDSSFTLPADGAVENSYSIVFRGDDPIRPATGITIVPEPSAILLSALSALALLRRKR